MRLREQTVTLITDPTQMDTMSKKTTECDGSGRGDGSYPQIRDGRRRVEGWRKGGEKPTRWVQTPNRKLLWPGISNSGGSSALDSP